MIFSTYTYALFLLATFIVHALAPLRARPWILIAASYFFYATWRAPYVALLVAVTLFNWAYARYVLADKDEPLLWPGVLANVALLLYFKYTNFILGSASELLRVFGVDVVAPEFDITLPLGVSFFTFQGIAYLVDVAAGEAPITRIRDFLLYKAFWPQLIAGPIIRPDELREQLEAPRVIRYDDVSEGARRILRGAFKKVAIADTLAQHVDLAFIGTGTPHALDTLAATLGFGFQIYFDFSAYSDFAIGSARLFGFRFPENFNWPYRAASPQEFWNRWHMTLSRWIRDYVFTPISFAFRARPGLRSVWLVVAMTVCGLWHGAAWTFVLWGAWHGAALVAQQTILAPLFRATGLPARVAARLLTLAIVFAGWLLFRAPSLASVGEHLHALATMHGGFRPALIRENGVLAIGLICGLALLASLASDSLERGARALYGHRLFRAWLRPSVYAVLLALVIVLDQEAKAFVYFQF